MQQAAPWLNPRNTQDVEPSIPMKNTNWPIVLGAILGFGFLVMTIVGFVIAN